MKTKISLTIVGVYNILMSLVMAFAIKDMIPMMLNTEIQEAARMVEIMHYGLFPAILIIGLICILCRNESLETAKKILLAYIIGTTVLMFVFFTIFSNEPLMNFGVDMIIPDIVVYLIAIFGYLKAK
jgi:glucan phosphoethanolaminetransferase (alkaline phosphatase superfamily)|tara:strand:+ start:586 stop:966 length:381 start_codon:yes stop_codon:yes gene_type:complete